MPIDRRVHARRLRAYASSGATSPYGEAKLDVSQAPSDRTDPLTTDRN